MAQYYCAKQEEKTCLVTLMLFVWRFTEGVLKQNERKTKGNE